MRSDRSRTKALVLYAILLGLPAAILVVVLWQQQHQDSERDRDGVAAALRFDAEMIAAGVASRLEFLLAPERELSPELFGRWIVGAGEFGPGDSPSVPVEPSPLGCAELPEGLLGRFFGEAVSIDRFERALSHLPRNQSWWFSEDGCGGQPDANPARTAAYRWLTDWYDARWEHRVSRSVPASPAERKLLNVSALDLAMLRAQLASYPGFDREGHNPDGPFIGDALSWTARQLQEQELQLELGKPWLSLVQVEGQTPLAIYARVVRYDPTDAVELGDAPSHEQRAHVRNLVGSNMAGVQGWVLDPAWLLGPALDQVVAEMLGPDEALVPNDPRADLSADHQVQLRLLERLKFERAEQHPELGRYTVIQSEAAVEARALNRRLRFYAAAAMLLASFSTGLYFLLSSVNRELEAADRVQNFVSAVTHELRTPVSTIALHTEMLQENWVSGPEQRDEYYARIANEAERLGELVERVLRKARLGSGQSPTEEVPVESDLSELVSKASERVLAKREDDVRFELGEGLPPALLTKESIDSIVENLVENARKYAPVAPGGEPILVRTSARGSTLLLEVCDRGDGVPKRQAAKVFEAFYRVGSERTRSAKGTGLGLHLVQLQAEALGGRARVLEREDGGALFQVEFPASDPSA